MSDRSIVERMKEVGHQALKLFRRAGAYLFEKLETRVNRETIKEHADRIHRYATNLFQDSAIAADADARLKLPLMLEDGRAPVIPVALSYAICGLIVLALIWSMITKVDEQAHAPGQIRPVVALMPVQHLEGGLIAEVFVAEGEVVQEGDRILRLHEVAAQGELDQLQAREVGLELRIERLSAFIEERRISFTQEQATADLIANETGILHELRRTRDRQRDALNARIQQRKALVQSLEFQEEKLRERVDMLAEREAGQKTLVKKQAIARAAYLQTAEALTKAQGELVAVQGDLIAEGEKFDEARANLEELEAKHRNDALEERSQAVTELAQVQAVMTRAQDRVTRLNVIAPAKGIVQNLFKNKLGEVVEPGEIVAQLLPLEGGLIAEVRLSPSDVGYVSVGNEARLRVTAYDAGEFGMLLGRVARISATTVNTAENEPFYKAIIDLDQNSLSVGTQRLPILPGMIVDAQIITGSKSLASYFVSPISGSVGRAFHER